MSNMMSDMIISVIGGKMTNPDCFGQYYNRKVPCPDDLGYSVKASDVLDWKAAKKDEMEQHCSEMCPVRHSCHLKHLIDNGHRVPTSLRNKAIELGLCNPGDPCLLSPSDAFMPRSN